MSKLAIQQVRSRNGAAPNQVDTAALARPWANRLQRGARGQPAAARHAQDRGAPRRGQGIVVARDPESIGLHSLKPKPGSRRPRKRVGRGEGSGLGKQSGRGHKGAGARSGSKRKAGYEAARTRSTCACASCVGRT